VGPGTEVVGVVAEVTGPKSGERVSAYRFAADPRQARRLLDSYAAMFQEGVVADIGAGRGYFLEALARRGIEGLGVDHADESVAEGDRIGVPIVKGDALEFLARQRDLGGVFLSHIVEHLPPEAVQQLLVAAHAALRPAGTIVLVTPNPRDLMVLTEIFWLDTTHVRPYPSKLLEAMLETAGFVVTAKGVRNGLFGRRVRLSIRINRIRFGPDYGRTEIWVRAERRV
jgi:SAM-dependent methyltransferase